MMTLKSQTTKESTRNTLNNSDVKITNKKSEDIIRIVEGLIQELGSEGVIHIAQRLDTNTTGFIENPLEHSCDTIAQHLANGGQLQFFDAPTPTPTEQEPQYTIAELNTII